MVDIVEAVANSDISAASDSCHFILQCISNVKPLESREKHFVSILQHSV